MFQQHVNFWFNLAFNATEKNIILNIILLLFVIITIGLVHSLLAVFQWKQFQRALYFNFSIENNMKEPTFQTKLS